MVQNEKIIAQKGKTDELKKSFLNPTEETLVPPTPMHVKQTPKNLTKPFSSIFLIIKVQAMVRGFLQRKRFGKIKHNVQLIDCTRFFKPLEMLETLQESEKFNGDTPLEEKTYTYTSTNAVYTGQMSGGFRHGQGTMTWSSGAKYEGQWSKGEASGKGKLTTTDGILYEGQWLKSKCNGFGTFTDGKGLNYQGNWQLDELHG